MKKVKISVPVGGFEPEQVVDVDEETAKDWVAHGLAQYVETTPSIAKVEEGELQPILKNVEKMKKQKKEA